MSSFDIIQEMIAVFKNSAANLRNQISNVKYGPVDIDNSLEYIYFDIVAGEKINPEVVGKYKGALKARNRDLILTGAPEVDAGIAVRVFLDGDAKKIA